MLSCLDVAEGSGLLDEHFSGDDIIFFSIYREIIKGYLQKLVSNFFVGSTTESEELD